MKMFIKLLPAHTYQNTSGNHRVPTPATNEALILNLPPDSEEKGEEGGDGGNGRKGKSLG